jgi:RHH-type proline utilization regulon transcriptional repressor/proline dehydrogenase/delta 1-pyrroline-5-carboxylate dehydrogenase
MLATPRRSLDDLAFAYGQDIFARLDRAGPTIFSPAWFDDLFMGLTMSDEALKVQLFRFIDALPLLHDPLAISHHLREYLSEPSARLPNWVRRSAQFIPLGGVGSRFLAWSAKWNAERLARRFISGSNVAEASAAVLKLRKQSLAFTLDLLGEATLTEREADHVQKQYLDLLTGLPPVLNAAPEVPGIDRDHAGPLPRVNVSVKLSALFSQFDPIDPDGTTRSVLRRLRPLLRLAKEQGAFVNFDMEQFSFKDTTLHIFRTVLSEPEFRDWPDVGIAIQAYLRCAADDLRGLLCWVEQRGTPVWIRLVKGAYWDYETVIAEQNDWPVPVWTRKWQSDAHYEVCTRILLENYQLLRPAFGSHNVRSLAHALALADQLNLPARSFEIQMLYGMADPIKTVLTNMGQRVRVYAPYGQLLPGMAYLVRRLLENTSNESFLRASFADHVPEEVLLMNPTEKEHGGKNRPRPSSLPAPHSSPSPHSPLLTPFKNEPLSDFSQAEPRARMTTALQAVAGQFGATYPPIINQQPVATAQFIESVNPSRTAQVLGKTGRASVAQAEQAIAAAKAAFPAWRETPVSERAALLQRIAAGLRARRWELAAWLVYEAGKPWREADGDVAEAIDFCVYYALEMQKLAAPQHRDVAGELNEYFYEPRGVAVVIAPWNFPLAILCGMTVAALVTGNPVIMKPAEQTGIVAAKLMQIIQAAGAPPGVIHYLPGVGEEIGPTLVGHKDVALIAFTGSLGVGLSINALAAQTPADQHHVKRVIAEMGGKNAVIVDSDADLDEAVKGVVDSAFGYAGQKCSACSRAIVVEPLYDAFLARLVEATKALTVASADEPGCSVPPVIDAEARTRILQFIETGTAETKLAHAADIGPLATQGSFVGPHIFAEVAPSATIAQEEIFGPVLAVLRAKDLDDALTIANGTRFALTGGFFSRSPANIAIVRRRFRVGNLYINRKSTGALVDRQPFGGFALSGIGSKAGGPDYLLQFVVPRVVTENTLRRGFAPAADAPVG